MRIHEDGLKTSKAPGINDEAWRQGGSGAPGRQDSSRCLVYPPAVKAERVRCQHCRAPFNSPGGKSQTVHMARTVS